MSEVEKKKYTINVKVIRAYVIEVEGDCAGDALRIVENMSPEDIDSQGEYVDTHTICDPDIEV